MKYVFFLIMIFSFFSCGTVTLKDKGAAVLSSSPDHSETKKFYLGGLVNEHTIYPNRICGDKGVRQIQTKWTGSDVFLQIITLTIYAPRTVEVWCGQEEV